MDWPPTGTEALRNAATNLIVVETKKKYSTSCCAPQVIGYMGKPKYQRILDYSSRLDTNKKTPVLIYWARKKEQEPDVSVYGIGTDGEEWKFFSIDNTSFVR